MSQNPLIRNKRLWGLGAIALGIIVLLMLIASSGSDAQLRGSSYNRTPDGYGAWYSYMEERGTPITRWRKPADDLADETGITLVRVSGGFLNPFSSDLNSWLSRGNRLVQVGHHGRVTDAQFSSIVSSDVGAITLKTRRRNLNESSGSTLVLQDDYGAIAWSRTYGDGEVIFIVPSDFAANAYQDAPGNYEFLAQLVAQEGDRLLIDEYIHGYKDADVILEEVAASWLDYLAQTPLTALFLQGTVMVLIGFWAANRRSRPPMPLSPPETNNSKAYIEALASVLQKAENRDFVVDVIGREEQRQIQRRMGLGSDWVEPEQLLHAWQQQTGRPAAELNTVLRPYWEHQKLSESALVAWIRAIQSVHRVLETGK